MSKHGSSTWKLRYRNYIRSAQTPDEISFVHDEISLPDGRTKDYYFADSPYRVAMIAAVSEQNEIALIEQYRYLFGEVLLELPAGSPEGSETLEEGARRELLEEAGLIADNMVELGNFYPAVGITNQDVTIFLATGLSGAEQKLDDDEEITVHWMNLPEAVKAVNNGSIKNQSAALGILLAARHLNVG
ncbi:MAG: NUDIX hydrolase [Chloroflexota bacterium]|nr:NUDIX hydrolase [Chloroflexota bacterium]